MWEWEDGEEAARPSEEVPVDFDFISLLSKPKVKPNPQPASCEGAHGRRNPS